MTTILKRRIIKNVPWFQIDVFPLTNFKDKLKGKLKNNFDGKSTVFSNTSNRCYNMSVYYYHYGIRLITHYIMLCSQMCAYPIRLII